MAAHLNGLSVNSRFLWDKVHTPLTLLLLQKYVHCLELQLAYYAQPVIYSTTQTFGYTPATSMKCRAQGPSESSSSSAAHPITMSQVALSRVQLHTNSKASFTHSCEASNLVSQSLGLDYCNLLCNSLVCMKVEGQSVVVFLNDDPRRLLDGLGTNATLHVTGKAKSRSKHNVVHN